MTPCPEFCCASCCHKKYYSDHSIYKVPYIFLLEACHSGIVLRIASSGSLHVRLVSLSISVAAKACSASAEFKALQHSLSTTIYSWKKYCALWWSRPETSTITTITILSMYQIPSNWEATMMSWGFSMAHNPQLPSQAFKSESLMFAGISERSLVKQGITRKRKLS